MNAHYAPLHPVRCLDETNCSSLRGGAFCQGPKVQREKAMNIANVVRSICSSRLNHWPARAWKSRLMPEQPWIVPIPCVSCRETIRTTAKKLHWSCKAELSLLRDILYGSTKSNHILIWRIDVDSNTRHTCEIVSLLERGGTELRTDVFLNLWNTFAQKILRRIA